MAATAVTATLLDFFIGSSCQAHTKRAALVARFANECTPFELSTTPVLFVPVVPSASKYSICARSTQAKSKKVLGDREVFWGYGDANRDYMQVRSFPSARAPEHP